MKGYTGMSLNMGGLRNEKGSSTYTFLGFAIVAVVVVAAVMFDWSGVGTVEEQPKDENIIAGQAALATGQYTEALAAFDKALQTNPDSTDAMVGKSKAYLGLNDIDKALEEANASLKKKPTAGAYGQKAIVEKIQKKYDEALKDFSEAINLDGNFAWAYAQRADLLSRKKEHIKALQDINQAVSAKPNNTDFLRLRVWILNKQGKCKEAAKDIKKVEELNPTDPWTIQDRAWFLLTCPDEKLQDPAQAMELAKQALEASGGKDGVMEETIAEAYFKQNLPLQAIEHQTKAIELGSQKCPDQSCLKEMQERLEKYKLAARQEIRSAYEMLPLVDAPASK
jgi:tetratricopeptide (TPR) repeat protein